MSSVFFAPSGPSLNLPENLLSVEYVGDKNPTASCKKVLDEVFSVGLAVNHAPAEGEVVFKHLVTDVDKDGVHT